MTTVMMSLFHTAGMEMLITAKIVNRPTQVRAILGANSFLQMMIMTTRKNLCPLAGMAF